MLSVLYIMKVGEIQGYDVIYVPEKDIVFCKNTTIKYPLIKRMIKSSMCREEIPEKELIITKNNGTIYLGCLTTTLSNCDKILREINKIKRND